MSESEGCWRVKSRRGWRGAVKREQYLKRKTRENVKGHSQLGCQMDDLLSRTGLCLLLFVPCNCVPAATCVGAQLSR